MNAATESHAMRWLRQAVKRLPGLITMALMATVVAGITGSTVVIMSMMIHGGHAWLYLPLMVFTSAWIGMIIAAPLTACLPLLMLLLERHPVLLRRLLPLGGLLAGALHIAAYNRPFSLPDNMVDGTMFGAGAVAGLVTGLFCRLFITDPGHNASPS